MVWGRQENVGSGERMYLKKGGKRGGTDAETFVALLSSGFDIHSFALFL